MEDDNWVLEAYDPVFDRHVDLLVGDKNWAREEIKDRGKVEDIFQEKACCVHIRDNKYVIWLEPGEDVATLTHECVHLVLMIFRYLELFTDFSSETDNGPEETFVRYVEFWVRELEEGLR